MIRLFLVPCVLMACLSSFAQGVKVSTSPGTPDASAILDVESGSQGFLPPRMSTAQRMNIANPVAGLQIFNTDMNCIEFYNGTNWFNLCGSLSCSAPPTQPGAIVYTPSPDPDAQSFSISAVEGATSYTWIVPESWSIVSGNGTTSIVVSTTGGDASGNVAVTAQNMCGASAASNSFFSLLICGGQVSDIDNNTYNTIAIGSQCWLKENLRVSKYKDNSSIPNVTAGGTSAGQWSVLTTGAWASYDNNGTNDAIYGKLYNWYAVSDARGICPNGWHVPSITEWTTLSDYLGGNLIAGGKLKSTSTWDSPNTGATNESGFTAIPAGRRRDNSSSSFDSMNTVNYLWAAEASSTDPLRGKAVYITTSTAEFYPTERTRVTGKSVRCLKD